MRSRLSQRLRSRRVASVAATALALSLVIPSAAALGAQTVRVSVRSPNGQGNDASGEPQVSTTGRFIVFYSSASNLVPNDTNGVDDCFRRDQVTRQTIRVTVDSDENQGDGNCYGPSVSGDGKVVAFESRATNLGGGSEADSTWDIFVRHIPSGTTQQITNGNGHSRDAVVSANGRYVAFESLASNLPGVEDSNGVSDVFVFDRVTETFTRVSRSSGGAVGNGHSNDPGISATGNFVVYGSAASNLVPGDSNGVRDIFRTNINTGNTIRVSVRSNGRQARGGPSRNATISSTGTVIAFESGATNLVSRDTNRQEDVFVRDLGKGKTTRVSVRSNGRQVLGGGYDPTVSGNGRYVAFSSAASNLVSRDTNDATDAFLHDRKSRNVRRVSVRSSGAQARGQSDDVVVSRDGRYVVFESLARNLVSDDTNGDEDVFRRGAMR